MPDDTLRDQVSRAVCAMTTGAERTDAVMRIIREQVDAERDRWEAATDSAVWVCARCGGAPAAHAEGGASGTCLYEPVLRTLDGTEAPA